MGLAKRFLVGLTGAGAVLDTTNIYSAEAFIISQGKYKQMLERLGTVRFSYDQNVIVISHRGVELGRGASVRQALEDVWQKAEEYRKVQEKI